MDADVMPWEMASANSAPNLPPGDVMPWEMAAQAKPTTGQAIGDNINATVGGALKDIGRNSLESLHNTAEQTGNAVFEPYNEKNVPWPLVPADIAAKTLGKVGNAIGGVYGAVTSPLTGALSASVENSGVIPAAASAIKNKLVPDDPRFTGNISPGSTHQIAMQAGGDLANAVMMGKAAEQGAAAVRQQQGLPPSPKPYDPLKPLLASIEQASQKLPGFLGETSSGADVAPQGYSSKAMYDQAEKYYKDADAAKAVIGQPKIQSIISDINGSLDNTNFDPDFHPQTAKWLTKLQQKSVDENGNPVDLPWSKVNGMRKLLNGIINDSMKQGGTEDGYQAIIARNALDKGTGSIAAADLSGGDPAAIDLTQKANSLWSAASKADDLQAILDKGQNAAVPSTAYKNGFNKLANDEAKMKGYSPDEQDAIRYAAKTGIVTGALKNVGSRLMSGIVGTGAGVAAGGPLGVPAGFLAGEAAGYPFRAAANALQRGRGQSIIDMIGNRPAVHAAMPSPLPPQPPSPTSPSIPIPALPLAPTVIPAFSPAPATMASMEHAQPSPQPLPAPTLTPPPPNQPQATNPLIDRIAQAESGGNPNAKNPNSSASGPLQFTDKTWADMVARYGKQMGITLRDKNNPKAQMVMGDLLQQDNAKVMTKNLGRAPTDGELYAAHFFGAPDVLKLINAQGSGKQAIMLYPRRLVNDNRDIFFVGNRPRTVEEVYALLNSKVEG